MEAFLVSIALGLVGGTSFRLAGIASMTALTILVAGTSGFVAAHSVEGAMFAAFWSFLGCNVGLCLVVALATLSPEPA